MSICHPPDGDDWEAVLPTLRVYVLGGGTENPLSADYEFLGMIRPPNYDYGMLDAVSGNEPKCSWWHVRLLTEDFLVSRYSISTANLTSL